MQTYIFDQRRPVVVNITVNIVFQK